MKSIYRKIVLLSLMTLLTVMTSCTDFLTIIPPDKIVHENFWQTKEDVNGMLATSYLKLANAQAVKRAIVWGELRADNLTYESSKSLSDTYAEIVMSAIDPENEFTKWSIFYEAINYANLVIEYAPLVVERDPDFTKGDLDVVVGEMYAMRALCHFYLVRTFRDIPMAMVPAINDSELPEYTQVHPLEALEMIMNDLDAAEGLVMPTGNYPDVRHNCGRFTKNAVLAIKADVNLWRAAFTAYYKANNEDSRLANVNVQQYYTQCIENCQSVLDNINKLYEKDNLNKFMEDTPYHLIPNHDEFYIKEGTYQSFSYDAIFGSEFIGGENSRESIFELQINSSLVASEEQNNTFFGIAEVYGCNNKSSQVEVPQTFLDKYEDDDLRKYSFTDYPYDGSSQAKIKVAKYVAEASPAVANKPLRDVKDMPSNWIVYRQTDVMLMMAEALVLQESANAEDIKESFKLVNAINRRSMVDSTKIENPLQEPTDKIDAYELVMDERVRELAFEGKRWYDLVRRALRDNTTDNIKFVADKLTNGKETLKNKMVSIDHLFFPINIEELRFNKNLKQNPAYNTGDSSIGMNK